MAPYSSLVLAADGTTLHVRRYGRCVTGPTCFLIHGTGDGHYVWEDLCSSLEGICPCVAMDLRGHGDSGPSATGRYDFDTYASDARGVIRNLGLRRLVLGGHSLGAQLVIRMAAGASLEDVCGAVLVDICSRPSAAGMERAGEDLSRQMRLYESLEEYRAMLLATRPLLTADMAMKLARGALRAEPRGLRLKADPAITNEQGHSSSAEEWDRLLGAIRCPTLVVRGRASAIVSAGAAARTASLLARGSLVEIERAGHAVMSDNPEAFNAALRGFFVRLKALVGIETVPPVAGDPARPCASGR